MVVNNNAQYCSVVKTGIGKSRLIIGGEVDACAPCSLSLMGSCAESLKYGIVDQPTKMLLSIGLN